MSVPLMMKLPSKVLGSVMHHMDEHHGKWHLVRFPRSAWEIWNKNAWDEAFQFFSKPPWTVPTPINMAGSGEEFLKFHRIMLRQFLWILEFAQDPELGIADWENMRWSEIPAWIRNPECAMGFTDQYLSEWENIKNNLISSSSLDELGSFLESNRLYNGAGANIHFYCHTFIAAQQYKACLAENDYKKMADAEMEDMATAHHNIEFWNLHWYLDTIYAEWQVANGETPDLSMLDPNIGHWHHHDAREDFDVGADAIPIM